MLVLFLRFIKGLMKACERQKKSGFTLTEIMIVVGVVGLLSGLAYPAFSNARAQSHAKACRNNRRVIFEALNMYCMDNFVDLKPGNFPNLCASRDTLAPSGSSAYVRDWKIFECPVSDSQNQHDYTYIWDGDVLVDIRCNNSSSSVRNFHNQ